MKYVVKTKLDNIMCYASECTIIKIPEIKRQDMVSLFTMDLKQAKRLMLLLVEMYSDRMQELAIVQMLDAKSDIEYQTVEYREFC